MVSLRTDTETGSRNFDSQSYCIDCIDWLDSLDSLDNLEVLDILELLDLIEQPIDGIFAATKADIARLDL